ncbi:hypothetical protein ACVB8X_12925 [Streptomyces sp. NRAIS4]
MSSDESLVAVARLLREFHDLTAGTALAGDHEVVCHNDLSPMNTVYRPVSGSLRPTAFIDWDLAAGTLRRRAPGSMTSLMSAGSTSVWVLPWLTSERQPGV